MALGNGTQRVEVLTVLCACGRQIGPKAVQYQGVTSEFTAVYQQTCRSSEVVAPDSSSQSEGRE